MKSVGMHSPNYPIHSIYPLTMQHAAVEGSLLRHGGHTLFMLACRQRRMTYWAAVGHCVGHSRAQMSACTIP